MPFRYEAPPLNPYAASIADLMLRQGDIRANEAVQIANAQARAQEQTGAIRGGEISGITNALASIPGQIVRGKAVQQESDIRKQQLESGALELKGRQRLADSVPAFTDIYKSTPKLKEGGLQLDDVSSIAQQLTEKGYGDLAEVYTKQLDASNERLKQHAASAIGMAKADAQTLLAIGAPPELVKARLDAYHANKVIDDTQHEELSKFLDADPGNAKKIAQYFASYGEPVKMAKPGEVPTIGGQQVGAPIPAGPPKTKAELALAATGGDPTKALAAMAPTPAAPSIQHQDVLLDGKPTRLLFNPKTEQYQDLSGQAITNPAGRIRPIPTQAQVTVNQAKGDAESIADAIEGGLQPPDVKGLYRLAGPVRAALAKRGYDMTTANLDWQATQKHVATLNGQQQTRLRQAISTASDSLDVIEDLAKKWDAGQFPILNKANLALAKNGAYGKDAASIATQLDGQITDVTSELGNVYMGGNSPTDHALKLAEKNLSANWDKKVLLDMTALARKNLQIRNNSMLNVGPAGLSTGSEPPSASGATYRLVDGKWVKQ